MDTELEYALVAWLNTFELPEGVKLESYEDLFDGLVLTEIMSKICPKNFDSKNIVKGAAENWSLVHKNLTYFYDGLSKYYFGVMYRPFDKNLVDILAISKEHDTLQLINLLELTIGAIINCEQREIYINAILYLQEHHQTQLMHLIKKIIDRTKIKESGEVHDVEKEKKLLIKLDEVENENAILITRLQESNDEKEKLQGKVNDLQQQCILFEEQIKNLNLKQEQFLSKVGIKDSEDYETVIKVREEKIRDLELFIKDLKLKQEQELSVLKEDLEIKKKKLLNTQKIENSLEYYKQKYEESLRISERKSELEKINEMYINKLEDFEKKINFLNAKISKYKEKISIEKNKAINLEIDISKKGIELESLRTEKVELENKLVKLEIELNDKNAQLEKLNLELHLKDLQKNETVSLGNELSDLIMNMEAQHNLMKIERRGSLKTTQQDQPEMMMLSIEKKERKGSENFNVQKELNEEQIELLERENSLLIEKLKELQKENERSRIDFQKINTANQNNMNLLMKEKEELKEEINKLKIITPNLANKELIAENKNLKNELDLLRNHAQSSSKAEIEIASKQQEELEEKNLILETQNKEIEGLKQENIDLKTEFDKFKEEFSKESFLKQSNEMQELQKEVKILRSLNNEEIEHKDDELRLLVAILYDLRIKYQELEKGKTTMMKTNKSTDTTIKSYGGRDTTPNFRKK